jgi:hypothetical protein
MMSIYWGREAHAEGAAAQPGFSASPAWPAIPWNPDASYPTLVSARHTQQEAIAWLIILRADSFVSCPISGSF